MGMLMARRKPDKPSGGTPKKGTSHVRLKPDLATLIEEIVTVKRLKLGRRYTTAEYLDPIVRPDVLKDELKYDAELKALRKSREKLQEELGRESEE